MRPRGNFKLRLSSLDCDSDLKITLPIYEYGTVVGQYRLDTASTHGTVLYRQSCRMRATEGWQMARCGWVRERPWMEMRAPASGVEIHRKLITKVQRAGARSRRLGASMYLPRRVVGAAWLFVLSSPSIELSPSLQHRSPVLPPTHFSILPATISCSSSSSFASVQGIISLRNAHIFSLEPKLPSAPQIESLKRTS